MPTADDIVFVAKVTYRKCQQEIVVFLAGPPDFEVTREIADRIRERGRAYHEGECLAKSSGVEP